MEKHNVLFSCKYSSSIKAVVLYNHWVYCKYIFFIIGQCDTFLEGFFFYYKFGTIFHTMFSHSMWSKMCHHSYHTGFTN